MNYIEENFRIYIKNQEWKILAELTYEEIEKGVFNINHTFVDESLKGQGLGGKLVEKVVEKIEKQNGKVVVSCSCAKNGWKNKRLYWLF